jgi:hypothetical protein
VVDIDAGEWISLDPVNFENMSAITFRVSGTGTTPRGQVELRLERDRRRLVGESCTSSSRLSRAVPRPGSSTSAASRSSARAWRRRNQIPTKEER